MARYLLNLVLFVEGRNSRFVAGGRRAKHAKVSAASGSHDDSEEADSDSDSMSAQRSKPKPAGMPAGVRSSKRIASQVSQQESASAVLECTGCGMTGFLSSLKLFTHIECCKAYAEGGVQADDLVPPEKCKRSECMILN